MVWQLSSCIGITYKEGQFTLFRCPSGPQDQIPREGAAHHCGEPPSLDGLPVWCRTSPAAPLHPCQGGHHLILV